MPSVTITLADTPSGGVSVYTDFCPAVGRPISLAQSAALDILRRTAREYGLPHKAAHGTSAPVGTPVLAAMAGLAAALEEEGPWLHTR